MTEIEIIRSRRRTVAIEIKNDMRVIVRAPLCMSDEEIKKFIAEKSGWIEKNLNKIHARKQTAEKPLSNAEIHALADAALQDIPKRVKYYAEKMSLSVGRITIRNQKTRWGSCSSKGNLNFNCLLMLCPEKVRDYVVVHELCHMYEMNHSRAFWTRVEHIMPDYSSCRKWLKDNGGSLIDRMISS